MCAEREWHQRGALVGSRRLDVVDTSSDGGSCHARYESVGVIADAVHRRMENHIVVDTIGPAAGPSVTRHRGSLESEQCRCRYH